MTTHGILFAQLQLRRPNRAARAFSLLELLCVIAIISILASMLLVAVSNWVARAKAPGWMDQARERAARAQVALARHYQNHRVPDPLTPDQLRDLSIITRDIHLFLKDKRVTFRPFASDDPNELIVLEVGPLRGLLGPTSAIRISKGSIAPVRPPN
jgi:prepilin-type N-terminal cleavage/methylation domain-containing protein